MAINPLGDKVESYCETHGLTEVCRLCAQNHFHSLDWDRVDNWPSVKESEAKDKRDSDTASIAREANRIAKQARNISLIAAIAAIVAAVVAIK